MIPLAADARVLVFDVNETLTDMGPLADRFTAAGLPGRLLPLWFAGVLRDGVALTLAGGHASFAAVARDGLCAMAADEGLSEPRRAADQILAGLTELPLHPDIPEGVRALRAAGFRLLTLTNGAAETTRAVLDRAGLTDLFEAHLDVNTPARWKPARAAYVHALDTANVPAAAALLISVHPWDIDGAARAGLATAWLRRTRAPYPLARRAADLTAASLPELADRLNSPAR
ncbi:haloacid dehalogenase type II [Streptomyces murinus]|uniref:haloacid dehalogenase type II n=1 Tax=Streptomyces murinus TaxID=33900 RepID=UPI003F475310